MRDVPYSFTRHTGLIHSYVTLVPLDSHFIPDTWRMNVFIHGSWPTYECVHTSHLSHLTNTSISGVTYEYNTFIPDTHAFIRDTWPTYECIHKWHLSHLTNNSISSVTYEYTHTRHSCIHTWHLFHLTNNSSQTRDVWLYSRDTWPSYECIHKRHLSHLTNNSISSVTYEYNTFIPDTHAFIRHTCPTWLTLQFQVSRMNTIHSYQTLMHSYVTLVPLD